MSEAVQRMFAGIARRYDLTNDVLSFGTHRLWRKQLLARAALPPRGRVLDLCTGTGDLAFAAASAVGGRGSVVGVDFVRPMLELAKLKSRRRAGNVAFLQGDAMALPFASASFDAVTVSFGIRNVDDPVACLQGINRVLRPGGKVVVLEFGRPRLPLFAQLYRLYSKYVMPLIGGLLTGDRAAYRYLPETASRFPDGQDFIELLRQADFSCSRVLPFMSGLAYGYIAERRHEMGVDAVAEREFAAERSEVALRP